MKYFLDTEFYEDGPYQPVQLISIGIVAEDGRELYLENAGINLGLVSPWLKRNVVPHLLRTREVLRPLVGIAHEIKEFIPPKTGDSERYTSYMAPEFWGYFADYDWVVFCQIFGTMMDLPDGYPMYCRDLMQYSEHLGIPRRAFPAQQTTEHNALNDARWNKELYEFLRANK